MSKPEEKLPMLGQILVLILLGQVSEKLEFDPNQPIVWDDISLPLKYIPVKGDVLAFRNLRGGDPSYTLVSKDKALITKYSDSLKNYQPEYIDKYPEYKVVEKLIKDGKVFEISPATRMLYEDENTEGLFSDPLVKVRILEGRYKDQIVWTRRFCCCRIYSDTEKVYIKKMSDSGRFLEAVDVLKEKWKREKELKVQEEKAKERKRLDEKFAPIIEDVKKANAGAAKAAGKTGTAEARRRRFEKDFEKRLMEIAKKYSVTADEIKEYIKDTKPE